MELLSVMVASKSLGFTVLFKGIIMKIVQCLSKYAFWALAELVEEHDNHVVLRSYVKGKLVLDIVRYKDIRYIVEMR